MLTPKGILSFPNLFSPKPRSEGAEPCYSCAILFDADARATKEYKALEDACVRVAQEKFGKDVKMSTVTMPFRDGNEKDYAGYPGTMFISPWTKQKPGVVDKNVEPIIDPSEVYAGNVVIASVTPFAWTASGRKGVSLGLQHVQVVKAGERIDGRASAEATFKPVDDDENTPF